jgi:hypothetical protein
LPSPDWSNPSNMERILMVNSSWSLVWPSACSSEQQNKTRHPRAQTDTKHARQHACPSPLPLPHCPHLLEPLLQQLPHGRPALCAQHAIAGARDLLLALSGVVLRVVMHLRAVFLCPGRFPSGNRPMEAPKPATGARSSRSKPTRGVILKRPQISWSRTFLQPSVHQALCEAREVVPLALLWLQALPGGPVGVWAAARCALSRATTRGSSRWPPWKTRR